MSFNIVGVDRLTRLDRKRIRNVPFLHHISARRNRLLPSDKVFKPPHAHRDFKVADPGVRNKVGRKMGIEKFIELHGRHFAVAGITYGVCLALDFQNPGQKALLAGIGDLAVTHLVEGRPIS